MKPSHALTVARRKVGAGDDWAIARWEVVGDTRDVLISGCVPGVFAKGPRKGQPKFEPPFQSCVVTDAEEKAELSRYEAETGNCGTCFGEAQVFARWHHIEGVSYRPCQKCGATGKATQP